MNDTIPLRIATLGALAALVALIVVASPAAAQDEPAVTQRVSPGTAAPGDTVTIEVDISAPTLSAPGIDVEVDPRWDVTIEDDANGRTNPSELQWIWSSPGNYSVNATATVPEDAAPGRYLVATKGSAIDRATGERRVTVRETPVTVEPGSSEATNDTLQPEFTVDETAEANETATVAFDTSASTPGDGITSYEWWFGDGETATGPSPGHAYPTGGSYLATLEVTDAQGDRRVVQQIVTVGGPEASEQAPIGPPTARIAVTPSTAVAAGTTVSFNASGSEDAEGEVVSYEWDLDGDGSFEAEGATTDRTYSEDGTIDVRLRVTDQSGATGTATRTVTVGSAREDGGGLPLIPIAAVLIVVGLAAAYVYTREQ